MKGITSIDPDFTGREVQDLVCAGCGTIGNWIEGEWSEVNEESIAEGSEEVLVCECGSRTFFVTRRTINAEETQSP
jgi:hypothetical protein